MTATISRPRGGQACRRIKARIWARDNAAVVTLIGLDNVCIVCLKAYDASCSKRMRSLDHIMTHETCLKSGIKVNNTPGNVVTVCRSCNAKRRHNPLSFYGSEAVIRILYAISLPLPSNDSGLGVE